MTTLTRSNFLHQTLIQLSDTKNKPLLADLQNKIHYDIYFANYSCIKINGFNEQGQLSDDKVYVSL